MQFLNWSGHCAVVMLHCFKLMLPLPIPVSNYDITINCHHNTHLFHLND